MLGGKDKVDRVKVDKDKVEKDKVDKNKVHAAIATPQVGDILNI